MHECLEKMLLPIKQTLPVHSRLLLHKIKKAPLQSGAFLFGGLAFNGL
jgi:hypothetical protein